MKQIGITRIRALRRAAARAAEVPIDGPPGWSRSHADPLAVVDAFPALRLRPEYTLHAYQYRADSGGNGVVWAVPAKARFTSPDRCMTSGGQGLFDVPRPPQAVDDVMTAFEGDGTPWSYMCSSILARELDELGALWHGCDWSTQSILGAPPWDRPGANDSVLGPLNLRRSDWTLVREAPSSWRPTIVAGPHGARVRFLTYNSIGLESIVEHLDCYHGDGYTFDSTSMLLAEGASITVS